MKNKSCQQIFSRAESTNCQELISIYDFKEDNKKKQFYYVQKKIKPTPYFNLSNTCMYGLNMNIYTIDTNTMDPILQYYSQKIK